MARNTKKYAYYTIGILRGSPTHRAILKDAEEHNTKQMPTIIGIRLSEYYQLRARGLPVIASTPETMKEAEADVDCCDHTTAINNAKKSSNMWED